MPSLRKRAPRHFTPIPSDFPANRLGGSDLFRTVLGGVPKSTFSRWLSDKALPVPVRLAGLNMWNEQVMADVMRHGTNQRTADAALT